MEMRTAPVVLLLTGAVILASCMAGCAVTDAVMVVPLEGADLYPPTDPATVEILHAEPQKPFETLGDIVIDEATTLSATDLERKLRVAVSKIGANAVIILPARSSPTHTPGSAKGGGQFLYAVAIRYSN